MVDFVKSDDGTLTAYSPLFGEHYHSTKDGALTETLHKHVIPAFRLQREKKELHILDICFGLGLNTLATIAYYAKHAPDTKLHIYSPEFDSDLIASLKEFAYPQELEAFTHIVHRLSNAHFYQDANLSVDLFVGDAREYIRGFDNRFDIVYQDAFSPKNNPTLWTLEYFRDISKTMKSDAILTTYSTALATRLALYENGFNVYLAKEKRVRNFTLASKRELQEYEKVDMEHKITCNPDAKPLHDTQVAQSFSNRL